MGFLTKAIEKRYSLADADKAFNEAIWGRPTWSGAKVSETTALNCSAVWACVRLLAETMGQVPHMTYRRLERGKERATDLPLYSLLHDAPNPEMPAYIFRETLQGHLGTWGNAYAEIEWDTTAGEPIALWPLNPSAMTPVREKGNLVYNYRLPDGGMKQFQTWQIYHIPGFGFNGLVGYSPVSMARQSIGMAAALEESMKCRPGPFGATAGGSTDCTVQRPIFWMLPMAFSSMVVRPPRILPSVGCDPIKSTPWLLMRAW